VKKVLGIILGGGAGTRLYPLTKLRAKPAVPLAGQYRLIDIPVSNCINSEIYKIYVLTQFNSTSLNRHIAQAYNLGGLRGGFVEVLAAQQTPENPSWFQGTADAVRQYLWLFKDWDVDEYVILSGDHLYRMDYRQFVQRHRETGADVTLSVIPIDEERASDFGLMKIDNNGRVSAFSEKPKGDDLKAMQVDTTVLGLDVEAARKKPYIASMGIYVFKKEVLNTLLAQKFPDQTDFGKEIIPGAANLGFNIQAFLFDGYWEDIGTIRAFYDANLALAQADPPFRFADPRAPIFTRPRFLPSTRMGSCTIRDSLIADGCLIGSSTVLEKCVVGMRTHVGRNVTIRNTVIMGADYYPEGSAADAETGPVWGIGNGAYIDGALLDKNVSIGRNARLVASEAPSPNCDFGPVVVRDGIVVVAKGGEVADNWQFPRT